MELVDGYDTLSEDLQEKVERAIKEKHVDDKDWNGVCIVHSASNFCIC